MIKYVWVAFIKSFNTYFGFTCYTLQITIFLQELLPLDSKDPNPYKYNSAVSFLHVWVRKEVNINILASDVNGTILRLPVPVESLVLIGWENYFQNEERVN